MQVARRNRLAAPGLLAPGSLGFGGTAGSTSAGTTPAAVPAAAGAPGGKNTITIGSGVPDYASAIENDPAYQQLKASLSAQGIGDAAHLRGAIQQALIQFGAVPDLPSDVLANSGLDTGGTKALAEGNPFSVLAQLAQRFQTDQQGEENELASRGILSSGETGYQLGRIGQANALANYNATSGLLGSIGTLNDQYLAGRQAAAQSLAQGAITSENTQAQQGPIPTTPTVTATYDPGSGTWIDPTGNHYDQNGNPVSFTPPPNGGGSFGGGSGGLAPVGSQPPIDRTGPERAF